MRTSSIVSTVLVAAATVAPAMAVPQEASIAIRAGRVITNAGPDLRDGIVVVQNGRIAAVGGSETEVPFDVILREFPDGVVFPGFAEAHSSSGMDRANENVAVAPFLDVKDSIDPVSFYFEDAQRGGVTAIGVMPGNETVIGGRGRVVAPSGMTVEQMTISEDLGMKISFSRRGWSRSAQLAELRQAFDELTDALERKGQELLDARAAKEDEAKFSEAAAKEGAAEKQAKEKEEEDWQRVEGFVRFGDDFPGKSLISAGDLDDAQRGLVEILNGDLAIWVSCETPGDVTAAWSWAGEHGIGDQVVFVVQEDCWKAAEFLASTGRPVALDGSLWDVENDPVTWEEKRTFVPKVLHEAGVEFSIASNPGRLGPNHLGYQAATCVREGVPRAVALAAVTARPASMWGLGDRLGTLRPGADGTFTVMSGDPLDVSSSVLEVYVRGRRSYERASDERLQRLLEGDDQ